MRKKRAILAFILAMVLAMPFSLPLETIRAEGDDDDFATSEQLDELEELKRREAELAAEQSQYENDMAVVRADVRRLQGENEELAGRLESLRARGKILGDEYDLLMTQLQQAKAAMDLAVADYEAAQKEVDDKQTEYEDRLVAMYKRSNQSKLEVLLSSDGLTGFFTNLELLGVIGRSDKQVLEELTEARETAAVKKTVAEESRAQYENFVAEKQQEIVRLEAGVKSAESEIEEIERQIIGRSADLEHYTGLYNQTGRSRNDVKDRQTEIQGDIRRQAEATRAAWAELTRAAAEATRQAEASRAAELTRQAEATRQAEKERSARTANSTPRVTATGLALPVSGSSYISSYYGWRTFPLNPNRRDFHTGLDFPAGFNHPVVAVMDGTVIHVSYPRPNANYGGWGLCNYIIIQHDNGLQSVYGHLKSINVSAGQRVSRGQRIAGVGSTGYSTGPHLHFEIRIPGDPNAGIDNTVNPYPYLFG